MAAIAAQFGRSGGIIRQRYFTDPSEFGGLPEPVIVNATGFGAKALFGDDSLAPVRGQIAWFERAEGVPFAVSYRGVTAYRRGDVTLLQKRGETDDWGRGDTDETPREDEAREALATIAQVLP
jgi:hypothetical protein